MRHDGFGVRFQGFKMGSIWLKRRDFRNVKRYYKSQRESLGDSKCKHVQVYPSIREGSLDEPKSIHFFLKYFSEWRTHLGDDVAPSTAHLLVCFYDL